MEGVFFGASLMAAILVALGVDALLGEFGVLWNRIGHPVVWIGKIADRLEARFNTGEQRIQRGGMAWARIVLYSAVAGGILQVVCLSLPYGWVWMGLIGSVGLAARSLDQHVRAVAKGLDSGLPVGRAAVSQIVGRDPDTLDEAGVARAAIESLAENGSDGFVAPLFWFAVLGLPGLFAYKAINTLDSMWGHKSERYIDFGRVAAKVDDWANWIPARLSAFWISLATGHLGPLIAAFRDAPKHASPNAGWPEAAFADALNLSLAGPRSYDGQMTHDAPMGNGSRAAGPHHIRAALRLFWFMWALAAMTCLMIWVIQAV